MTKVEFIKAFSQGYVGDNEHLERRLAKVAEQLFETRKSPVTILDDDYTLTEEDSGGTFLMGTDAKVITLPATAAGLEYTIVNSGAAGNNIITVSPQAADGISGTFTLAASVVVDAGVVNKDIINTKATAKTGDFVKLVGTGVAGTTAWIVVGSAGIWAAQG
jgi:hypothetical protein